MSNSFNVPTPCESGMCNVSRCRDKLCPEGLDRRELLPRCLPHHPDDPAGWDINTCSREEQEAYYRGMIEMAPVVSPYFSLTDKHVRTNDTFINRYLEDRKPRVPKGSVYTQLLDWKPGYKQK